MSFDFFLAFMLIMSLVAICAIGVYVGVAPVIRDLLTGLGESPGGKSPHARSESEKDT